MISPISKSSPPNVRSLILQTLERDLEYSTTVEEWATDLREALEDGDVTDLFSNKAFRFLVHRWVMYRENFREGALHGEDADVYRAQYNIISEMLGDILAVKEEILDAKSSGTPDSSPA